MKTDIQTFKASDLLTDLTVIAPSICLEVIWSLDSDAKWDCGEGLDPDDFTAWQSEVKASAIVGGELISGSAYLCGTWIEYGRNPAQANPEISG